MAVSARTAWLNSWLASRWAIVIGRVVGYTTRMSTRSICRLRIMFSWVAACGIRRLWDKDWMESQPGDSLLVRVRVVQSTCMASQAPVNRPDRLLSASEGWLHGCWINCLRYIPPMASALAGYADAEMPALPIFPLLPFPFFRFRFHFISFIFYFFEASASLSLS